MECKLCKGYLYSYNTQVQPATMPIYIDDNIFDSYKSYTSSHNLIPYTAIAPGISTPFWQQINSFLGVSLFNKTFPIYANSTTSDPWDSTCQGMTDPLGLYIDVVSNPNNNESLSFVTLDGVLCDTSLPKPHLPTYFNIYTPFIKGQIDISTDYGELTFVVFPTTLFNSEGKVANREGIKFTVRLFYTTKILTGFELNVLYSDTAWGSGSAWINDFKLEGTQPEDKDIDNPYYEPDDNPGGDGPNLPNESDPTDFPDLPTTGVGDAGLITIFRPSLGTLQAIGAYLWTGLFDVNNFKKLFANPMDCLVGLSIVPASPTAYSGKRIMFGNVDTGIDSNYVKTQYCSLNCGSIKINKKIGDFLDYEATKVTIFLPYIGFRELSTADVMGKTLTVQYNIDILSGACAAFIKVSSLGVAYAYNGSCISNVPLTATNYSSAIQNAVTAVASGAGVIAGAMTGAAPVTAMSAASLLSSAANTVINSRPSIQRSGNLGGSAGIMSGKKPFVIIERPNYSVPDYYQNYVGRVCNKTAKLGSLSGFTMVESVHLDGLTATAGEITEIESLLKSGVIL